jgi:arginyl-tRNA synthetase
MSSRTGNVILFSQLCALLREDIYDKYLWRHDPVVDGARRLAAEAKEKAAKEEADRKVMAKKGKSLVGAGAASAVAVASHDKKGGELASTTGTQELWSQDQLQEAEQRIAVATIRYGMLRHDLQKDIVFVLDAWTSRSGDSGPYLLYAYARIRKMVRDLGKSDSSSAANFDLLEHDTERATLRHMHVLWDVVNRAADTKSPSLVCTYLFELAKLFSAWYETPACSIRKATTPELAIARLAFCDGIGRVLQFGLGLLGIATLDCM